MKKTRMSNPTVQLLLQLDKALAILLNMTVSSLVGWEDLEPHWKSEKSHISLATWSTNLLFTGSSKTLLTTERRLTGQHFLAVDLSPTFSNTVTQSNQILLPFNLTALTVRYVFL